MYFLPTSTASPPFLFFSDFVLALWHVFAPPFPEMRTGRLVRDLGSCARVGAKERSSSSGVSSSHMDAGAISQRVIRDQQKLSSTHGQLGKQMGGDTSGTGEGRGFLKETVSLILTRQMCPHPCSPRIPATLSETNIQLAVPGHFFGEQIYGNFGAKWIWSFHSPQQLSNDLFRDLF